MIPLFCCRLRESAARKWQLAQCNFVEVDSLMYIKILCVAFTTPKFSPPFTPFRVEAGKWSQRFKQIGHLQDSKHCEMLIGIAEEWMLRSV